MAQDEDLRSELARSIERTLLDEARRNELRIAYVRASALAVATVLDVLFHLEPRATLDVERFSVANALLAAAWCATAASIAAALRSGWYHAALRYVLPVLDGVLLLSLFVGIFSTRAPDDPIAHPIAVTATACALLAVSGALRLARGAAVLTGALAVFDFAVVSYWAGFTLAQAAFVCGILSSAGLLGVWTADVVRRAVESEVAQVVLRRFLPREVIEDARYAPIALVTEPRSLDATVLVSDLRGFTSFAEALPPRTVLAFLNEIQGALARVVEEHGGTVDKFMGDGMLAVFGATEHHASRAIAAARAMVTEVALFNARRAEHKPIRVGIGVHSGSVVVGCLGSGMRLEFTVIGDTVNTASRLESLTKERQVDVLISDETARRASDAPLRPLGPVAIRGREEALAVHTLVDVGGSVPTDGPARGS